MFTHPTAPQRLPDLVEAFAQSVSAVVDLGHGCTDEDFGRPSPCPGWSVHDQISHVVGIEAWLEGHKDPRVEMPAYEHIRNDLGKRVEYAVEVRRGRTGAEVVAELEDVLAQRLSRLRDPGLSETSIIAGPFGQDQAATVMLLRTFDVWTHEQDIRTALDRPGDLDSPAAAVFVSTVLRQLPRLVAKGAGVDPGDAVVIDVTGPLTAREGARVELDEQGRHRGHAMLAADAAPPGGPDVSWEGAQASDGHPGRLTTISLSTEDFTRRAAGRRPVSDTEYSVVGDPAIASRVLEALVVTH
jgi:uncharacterized protein (TIGR03083 family)